MLQLWLPSDEGRCQLGRPHLKPAAATVREQSLVSLQQRATGRVLTSRGRPGGKLAGLQGQSKQWGGCAGRHLGRLAAWQMDRMEE